MAALPTLPPTLERLRESAVLFHDVSRSRIALVGDDRFTWLNGAASCDVVSLEKKRGARASYGCVLTVKGKILGDAYVVATDAELAAWIPTSSREAIAAQWEKYIVMEDVELAVDESRALLSLQGGRAAAIAEAAGLSSRGAPLDDLGVGGGVLFDVPRDEAAAIVERLASAGARVLDELAMHALRVEAGRATFGVDVDGKNYVQEGGLEKRAVSFSKGCYVGQEVVCMLQMRGHVHRKLAKLAFASGGAGVSVGAEVQVDGASVGAVTSVVSRDGEHASALAMLKYGVITPGARVKVGELEGEIVGEAS
jgi:folate-binding protein YgfZ